MGYVGTAPLSGDYRKLDDISGSFNGSTTDFTLQVGSANVTPPKATTMLISVGGILQEPVSAYTVSGSTISFTSAPASGADFFGVLLGAAVDIGTPSDATVTAAKLASTFLTGISATTTVADADLILIDDAAGGTFRKMTRAHFIESAALDAINIDGGAIDGTPIGANSASTISGTSGAFSTDVTVGDDLSLTSDAAVFNMGAGNDFTITHDDTTGATIAATPLTVTSATAATWSTSAGALTLNGTGGVNINEGGSSIISISDARAITTANTASIALDASGVIELNSSGGALSIGNDNVDQAVNIATAGTRTVNIGIDDGTDKTTINMLAAMHIDSTPADTVYSGITASFTAGEALEVGEVVYLKAADSRVWKAVSVASGTGLISAEIMCMGMVAVAQGSAGSAVTILLQGFLQHQTNFPTYAVGETLYVPEAEVSSKNVPEGASPDSTGDFVQVVGWAAGADTVFFNPDFTIIEHA